MNNLSTFADPRNDPVVRFEMVQSESLTTIGIFVSSLLLSLGGCIAVILSEIRKSRCMEINCAGGNCVRDVSAV